MVASKTVARVFQGVAFRSKSTRIKAPAVALSAEYIRLFIQEAVLRANAQRLAEGQGVDGIDNEPGPDSLDVGAAEELPLSDEDNFSDEDRGLGLPTQLPPAAEPEDSLLTRHLAAISGLLVMDF